MQKFEVQMIDFRGRIYTEVMTSKLLLGNPAKCSEKRIINVYLSEGEQSADIGLIALAPWTQAGRSLLEWKPFKESLPHRVDRLSREHRWPNIAVICPDLYTDFGGSQYVDSDYFGPHASFVVDEMMPLLAAKFGVKKWGVFGRSSGGFGALRMAMDFPGIFSAVAAHSADLGFDTIYSSDLLTIPNKLRRFSNSWELFYKSCMEAKKLSGGDIHALMLIAMAGFYSSNANGFDLPIDLYTGQRIEAVWKRWLDADPVYRIDRLGDALVGLKYMYLECGLRDQYHLLYGARRLHQKLQQRGIEHQYEEFDDDHSGTDYRYDVSLPAMIAALR